MYDDLSITAEEGDLETGVTAKIPQLNLLQKMEADGDSPSASTIDLDASVPTPFNRQFASPFPLPVRAGTNARSSASRYPKSRAATP